jgi:hypothetical protein
MRLARSSPRLRHIVYSLAATLSSVFLVLGLLFGSGCGGAGGGTEGTGFRSVTGVVSEGGNPVSGSTVILEETGATTTTDSSGSFVFDNVAIDASVSQVTLRVEDQGMFSAAARITNVPPSATDVIVAITINKQTNEAVVTQVVIVTPAPTATPTAVPTAVPTSALPTATPDPEGHATTAPTNTPTPQPTATGTPVCVVIINDVCRLDMDESGSLNVADFTSALQHYAQHDLRMDINGDGLFTSCDFDSYEASYTAASPRECPAHYTPTPTPTP